jgi:hypothetical protein
MNFFKKIVLAIIIIVFSAILFYLYKRRLTLLSELEGFLSPNRILELNDTVTDLPLCQYCIKASHNTALTSGNEITLDMIEKVLATGCRFLDFEVYFINRLPAVAYSTDSTYSTVTTKNYILLKAVLDRAVVSGFSSTPNRGDPLFIHLRVKAMDENVYIVLYREIAKVLDSLFPKNSKVSRYYSNSDGTAMKINKDTLLSDIMGKVIIVFDKSINENYRKNTDCTERNNTIADELAGVARNPEPSAPTSIPPTKPTRIFEGLEVSSSPTPTPTTPRTSASTAPPNQPSNLTSSYTMSYSSPSTATPITTPPRSNSSTEPSSSPTISSLTSDSDSGSSTSVIRTTPAPTLPKRIAGCYDLKDYINLENGTSFLRTNTYSTVLDERNDPPYIEDDNINTNVISMRHVEPGADITIINPNIEKFIINHGCQVVAYQYYHDDAGLESCEEFFSDNKFAFVPISKAIRYFKKKQEQMVG